MSDQHKTSWETYTRSWKAATAEEKRDLLDQSMVENGVYRDPLMETHTREALVDYMLDFHKQIPGGHFVTKHYQRHHNVGLVEWEMRNGEDALVSTGTSFAEFDPTGKLISATGFFEVPGGAAQ